MSRIAPPRSPPGARLRTLATPPKPAEVLEHAEPDVLGCMVFPREHWIRIYSTDPLERLNEEIKRRTNAVGVFPDEASAEWLVGAVLLEHADEGHIGRRYFSLESMAKLLAAEPMLVAEPEPLPQAPVTDACHVGSGRWHSPA